MKASLTINFISVPCCQKTWCMMACARHGYIVKVTGMLVSNLINVNLVCRS